MRTKLHCLLLITSLLLLSSYAHASIPMGKIKCMDTSKEMPGTIHEIQLLNASSDTKADTVIHEGNEEQVKTRQNKKTTDVKTVGQVIAGSAGLILGFIAGALFGMFLGYYLIDKDDGPFYGGLLGAAIGGITLSSLFIYATANKSKGEGSYWSALGGVTLGAALSLLFPPLLLLVPAIIGTNYYNSSRNAPAEEPVKKKTSEW